MDSLSQKPLTPSEYADLVSRVRAVTETVVAAGATVLVVSRGDDTFLRVAARRLWHFPQTEKGMFAGEYPADGTSAVSHLSELIKRGATHIVFPATALWWLDYYPELTGFLAKTKQVCQDRSTCLIYDLEGSVSGHSKPSSELPLTSHTRELIDAVLPSNARIAIAVGSQRISNSADSRFVLWGPTSDDARRELKRLETLEVSYLVVAQDSEEFVRKFPNLSVEVEHKYKRVLSRSHLCSVFDITDSEEMI